MIKHSQDKIVTTRTRVGVCVCVCAWGGGVKWVLRVKEVTVTQRNQKYWWQIIRTAAALKQFSHSSPTISISWVYRLQEASTRHGHWNGDAATQGNTGSHVTFFRQASQLTCEAFFFFFCKESLPLQICQKKKKTFQQAASIQSQDKFICVGPFKHKGNSKWGTRHIASSSLTIWAVFASVRLCVPLCTAGVCVTRNVVRADFVSCRASQQ